MVKFGLLALTIVAVAIWFFAQNAPRDTPSTPGSRDPVVIETPNPLD